MIWFFLCVGLLIAGYFIYGKFIERIFSPKPELKTPAITMADGVDYVPMSDKKVYLVQLLNIAGVGPIFGPILGALYGPVAMLWIVFGCIFAGAVHDYFSGMLSVHAKGASVPTVVGEHLGTVAKHFMNLFAVVLLMLVGVAGYVRYHRNQEHTTIRRLEVEAEQAVLCARKTCGTCDGQTITDREVDRVAGRKR